MTARGITDRSPTIVCALIYIYGLSSLLRWSIFGLSDVSYTVWNLGYHSFQSLCQADLATQTRSAEGEEDEKHVIFKPDKMLLIDDKLVCK